MRWHNALAALSLLVMLLACSAPEDSASNGTEEDVRSGLLGEQELLAGLRVDTLTTSAELLQEHLERVIQEESAALRDEVATEAFGAVEETQTALRELGENNAQAALAALERGLGKLDILLARRPELGLVPLDFRARVVNMQSDIETAEDLVERAEDLLDDGQVQRAKRLLEQLTSELTVTTINLPLATYPDAIRGAVRQLEAADSTGARRALEVALNTLVIRDRIIPLPLIHASAMIEEAEALVEEGDIETAGATLNDAREQLRLAEVLGYGDPERDLEAVTEDIERLADRVAANEDTDTLFRTLKERLGQYRTRSEQPTSGTDTDT